jgi:Ca2+-transporting ATPase
MILASVIILIELIKLIIQSRRNRLLAQKQMLEDTKDVNVIRDGHTLKIHRKDIVVGDIICLHEGEIVPADAELLEANNLVVDESNIAGKKFCYKSLDPNLISQADTTSFSSHIISGSLIIHGEAVAQVYAVGQKTRVAVLSNNYQLQDKNKNIEHLSHSFT